MNTKDKRAGKKERLKRLSTETGAGQRASAFSFAAEIVASPSSDTVFGCKILEDMPDTDYSVGIAISEALEDAATRDDTK